MPDLSPAHPHGHRTNPHAVTRLPLLALLGVLLAGCQSSVTPDSVTTRSTVASVPAIEDGTVHMALPVPVFLLGYDNDLADALKSQLAPLTQSTASGLELDVRFEVYSPDAVWQARFDAFLATARHDGHADLTGFDGPILDGNAIEDYLDANLAEIAAVPDGLNRLVILNPHLQGHAYHYASNVGWREPVRTFGERTPLLIWDPQAEADPWVGSSQSHHAPMDVATADGLADWVRRAVAIRALHGQVRAPATEACHAVTVVLAVRDTALTPTILGLQSWEEVLDVQRLENGFEALVNDEVHVDLVVRHLPMDDPVLELVTRENNARVATATYLDLNFSAFHVPHEECAEYLSLVVFGDLLDQRTSSNGNAQTSLINGRRISTSLVAENVRFMSEYVGYNEAWDESTSFERVGPGADPLEWFNWVVAHETGHLFSLPHPNSGSLGGQSYSDSAFESTWNAMSYQMRRITTEMSQVDANNYARNQAAVAVLAAPAGAPRDAALKAMGEYRWKEAVRRVRSD